LGFRLRTPPNTAPQRGIYDLQPTIGISRVLQATFWL